MKKKIIIIFGILISSFLAIALVLGNIMKPNSKSYQTQLNAVKLYDSENETSNFDSSVKNYEIKDSDDVLAFFNIDDDTSGMTFTVTAEEDIDMQGKPLSKMAKFSGTLDGNSKKLLNLSFVERNDDSYAFIEELDTDAVIKNLTIHGITTPTHNKGFSTDNNGYVHFIHKLDSGAMLYNNTFYQIYLGCGYNEGKVYSYGYDDAALVGENNGLISNCYLAEEKGAAENPSLSEVKNYFYGYKHASIFASYGKNGSYIERCDGYGAIVYGYKYVGGIVAEQDGGYITSCLADSFFVGTIPSDLHINGFTTLLQNEFYKDTFENYVGGLVGKSLNSTVVNNVFFNQNGYLLCGVPDEDKVAVVSSSCGTTRIGGMVGYSNGGSIDYNLFEGSIQQTYVEGVSKANSIKNIVRGDGLALETKHCNVVVRPLDEADDKYFIDVSDGSTPIRTYTAHEAPLYLASPSLNGDGSTTMDFYDMRYSVNFAHCHGYTLSTIYDEMNPSEYKAYKVYYDNDEHVTYSFEAYSNQAYRIDTTNLEHETYYDDFINQGDDLFKAVEKSSNGYSEANIYKRITIEDEQIIFEFTANSKLWDKYYLAYYDAAVKNNVYYNSTFDPYEILEGAYYFICDSQDQSKLSRIAGANEVYRNINNVCETYDKDGNKTDDKESHVLYEGNTVRISNRIWVVGKRPVNYSINSNFNLTKETGYTLSYSYTRYDEGESQFIKTAISDFQDIDTLSTETVIGDMNFTVYYIFNQSNLSFTGTIQMDTTNITDPEIVFVNQNGQTITSDYLSCTIQSDLSYTMSITPDSSLNFSNTFVRFSYLNNDVAEYKILASLDSFIKFLGNNDSLHTVILNVNFTADESLEDELEEDFKTIIYFYPMLGSADPTDYYYSVVEENGGALVERIYKYGYPFNPLADYTLADNQTFQFDYNTLGVRGYLYDRSNSTFYLNVNNVLHNSFSSYNWTVNIVISKTNRQYKIFEYWNFDLVDSMNGKYFAQHDYDFFDYLFYCEPAGLYENNYCYTEAGTDRIPKVFDKKNLYLYNDLETTKRFMIIEIKYYTTYDPNYPENSIEYTGDLEDLEQDIYCVYTLAMSKSESMNYEYTYYDESFGFKYGEDYAANTFEFGFCSSSEAYGDVVDGILINQTDSGNYKHLSVYIPDGVEPYLWIIHYEDETHESVSNYYFAQTLEYIATHEDTILEFKTFYVTTDEESAAYDYVFEYGCGATSTGVLEKDNAFLSYTLANKPYAIRFNVERGYEIANTTAEYTLTNSVYEGVLEDDIHLTVEKSLVYYRINYYWTSGYQIEVQLANEDGSFYVNNISSDTIAEHWSSYTNEDLRGLYALYTINDTSINYILEEGTIRHCKYNDTEFEGFLIYKNVYTQYNIDSNVGVDYRQTPKPSDCREYYVVFTIAAPESDDSNLTYYHYKQYTMPNSITYGENTYNYSSDGFTFDFSKEKMEFNKPTEYENVRVIYGVEENSTDSTITCTYFYDGNMYLWALLDDSQLNGESPKVPILEDIDSDFTIYRIWSSQNRVTDDIEATIKLRNNTEETKKIIFDAYAYYISGYTISFDLSHYDEIGKSAYVHEISNYEAGGSTFSLEVTQNTSINVTLSYKEYTINYSWDVEGKFIFDGNIEATEINSTWIYANYQFAQENGFRYTVEDTEAYLNYYLNVNKMFIFEKDDVRQYALIAGIHFYQDSLHTTEFDSKPLHPFVGNVYVIIDLAFVSDSPLTYYSKEIGTIKLNGVEANYSFKYSSLEYYFEEMNLGSAAVKDGYLHYFEPDEGYLWLFVDDEAICPVSIDDEVLNYDYYSITIGDKDGDGWGYNYRLYINGEEFTEGDSGDTRVYYLSKGESFMADFTRSYDGEEGYEYSQTDNSFEIEKNKIVVENIDQEYTFMVDFGYKKSSYRVYFYIDKSDITNDPDFNYGDVYLDDPTFNAETYTTCEFESSFPAYPEISKEGYRLAGYVIYCGENMIDMYVSSESTIPSHHVIVYGDWVEAGRASFEITYYESNREKLDFEETEMSASSVMLYYVDNVTTEKTLMEQLSFDANNIDTMQYKVSVSKVMDGGYFYRYQFYFFPDDSDNGNLEVYLKLPRTSEYIYFTTLNEAGSGEQFDLQYISVATLNADPSDEETHIEVTGEGWYLFGDVVTLTLDIEEGYYAYFTDAELARLVNIYNSNTIRIASMQEISNELGSLEIALSVARRQYHIYYYLDGNLVHTDDYYCGDSVTIWEPSNEQLQGYRKSEWNDTLDTMPAANVTLYASIIYGITKEYTINFSGTVEEGMFFIADNKEEITARTIITEAVVLDNNRIEVTYKENHGFLWMVDPITKTVRYLNVDLDSITEINLVKYTIPDGIDHLSVSNLGYHLTNSIVGIEVTKEPGYTYVTSETKVGNILLISSKETDYEIDLQEEKCKYNIYYFIKDTLVYQDEYYYGDDIILWEYDPTLYDGDFNFVSWSAIPFEVMPASDVLVYGQEGASYSLITMPNVSMLHENETLGKAVFTGGLVKIGNEIIPGEFRFEDSTHVVKKVESATESFVVLFQPNDISLAPYKFEMTILVCNPKYDGDLDDIYLISRTNNSISLHINEKYEFYFENGSYQVGRDFEVSNLKENTTYKITYRYKADDEYCASDAYVFEVRTLSFDEMLYINSQALGLSVIDAAVSYFDNPTVQRYLSLYQEKLSKDYAVEMDGVEAQEFVEFLTEVIGYLAEIEDARIPVSHLDANRIMDYANKCIDELSNLAFNGNASTKNLARYKNYVINVLNVSDSIISTYNISLSDLINQKQSIKLTALTSNKSLDIQNQTSFVINKVDELLEYNYSNYSHVDLNEFKDKYIGNTVTLMKDVNKQVHHTDSQMVTQNISKCVTALQSQTYEDYTFNREEYDAIFFKAAEAAVVAHMQVIVLNDLDRIYIIKIENLDFTKRMSLKNVYLDLVDYYSDFDTFYLEYKKMIEAGNDMTYDDCISEFQSSLEAKLVIPVSSNLTSTEVIVVFVFASAVFALVCVIVARHIIIKRRAHYATGSRE